jgi:hypothetical protein
MLKQTIVWTALPHRAEGPPNPGATLRLSAFVAPRLWNDDGTPRMKLSQFPDLLDWPGAISGATFKVEFEGGPTLDATVTSAAPESDLWEALFNGNTDVIPFEFEDLSGAQILTFSAVDVHAAVVDAYQNVATNPTYFGAATLPKTDDLNKDPGLDEIRRPVHPEPPWVPTDKPTDVPVRPPEPPPPTPPPAPGCLGCLPAALLAPVLAIWALIRRVLKWLGLPVALSLLPFLGIGLGFGGGGRVRLAPSGGAGRKLSPGGGGGGGGGAVSPKKQALDDLRAFVAPTSETSQPLPTAADYAATYDFHKMVSALGDYPKLMRRMGLVVDLSVTIPAGSVPATGTIRLVPTITLSMTTTNHAPRTHYELSADLFVAKPRATGGDLANGLLRLQDANRFTVHQVDVASSGIKLQNAATNIVGLKVLEEEPANGPDEQGLPALATAGIAIVRPDARSRLAELFRRMYALNHKLAEIDGSKIAPLASGDAAPAPADDAFAEDLVRGYRIDIRDTKAKGWLSLSERDGTYVFLDAAGGPRSEKISDEGFVQTGVTESLAPSATRVLRAHETLFTWDGWSLAAPRPGEAILPDTGPADADHPDGVTLHGEVLNKAATPFHLETTFTAKVGSLPRLRYGNSYRVRARIVDLAGNSAFDPVDAAFALDQAEVTPDFTFRRFEPVAPPPVMLRAVPKEGESLERLTVRSDVFDDNPTILGQATERHLAPPKTSQLQAERHGHFDGPTEMRSDGAAYGMASDEAGSLTHRLDPATNTLKLIAGVKKVEDTALHRTYWLQENQTFTVEFLPDPFARGVLLRGLPGMAGIDDIQANVNRLPFVGPWPHLEPLRLVLTGLPAGVASPPPDWQSGTRVLTVGLAQGETATVLLASYFEQADLEQMGVWDWTVQKAPLDLAALRSAAVEGRNWLHLPYRTLTLVHAVQRPLELAKVTAFDPAQRGFGDTAAILNGTLSLDAKSTGKLDVLAEWSDPLDDPDDPTNDPTTAHVDRQMALPELVVADPANDSPTLKQVLDGMAKGTPAEPGKPAPPPPAPSTGLRHAIGDTKHHDIKYSLTATTRFREHFPAAIAGDPKKLIRPSADAPAGPESATRRSCDIPNSATPPAVRPVSILPTFQWKETPGAVRVRERFGGGLRIYLERPWYLTGPDEELGVVIKPAGAPATGDAAAALQKYASEWGMDPLWAAAATMPLTVGDFANGKPGPKPLPLPELPSQKVNVIGVAPGYDPARKLWYADLQLKVAKTYFPFVRLGLVRFQRHSIDGAHISPIILSDFVQVAPDRRVEYDLGNVVAGGSLQVRLSGPTHEMADGPINGATVVVARLESREFGDAVETDPVGWKPFDTIILDQVAHVDHVATWEGTFTLPAAVPSPLRVTVLEAEVLRNDAGDVGQLIGQIRGQAEGRGEFGMMVMAPADEARFGYRIVFADTTIALP